MFSDIYTNTVGMTCLTEDIVIARAKQPDISQIKHLNFWGGELVDVNIIERMPNLEVLSLTINKISSLAPFAKCIRLKELYLRKNKIDDICEIEHLRHLPALEKLWIEENPCCENAGKDYRSIVLRALPNLKKLDNVEVTQEELDEAMSGGGAAAAEDEAYDYAYEARQQQRALPQHQPQHNYPQHPPRYKQRSSQQQQRRSISFDQKGPNLRYGEMRPAPLSMQDYHDYEPAWPGYAANNEREVYDRPRYRRSITQLRPEMPLTNEQRFQSNVLTASLNLVKVLDDRSLEVLEHALRCRKYELSGE